LAYLKFFRKTDVTLAQARSFTPLFFMNKRGKWFAMKELNAIPIEERVPCIQKFLDKCIAEGIVKAKK
jgi:hypothetical protein